MTPRVRSWQTQKTPSLNHQKEYDIYKAEVLKSLQGKSKFNADILNELLTSTKATMEEAEHNINRHKRALEDSSQVYKEAQQNSTSFYPGLTCTEIAAWQASE